MIEDCQKLEQLQKYIKIFQQHEATVKIASTTLRETLHLSVKECLNLKDDLLSMRRHTGTCLEWVTEQSFYACHAEVAFLDGEFSAKFARKVEQYWHLLHQTHPDADVQLRLEIQLEKDLARCLKGLRDLVKQLQQLSQ
jgi:hypothetical protein